MNSLTRRLTRGSGLALVGATLGASALAGAAAPAAGARSLHPRSHTPSQTALYVSTKGTDTGTCQGLHAACATIAYALSQASAGDSVLVEPGTYMESSNAGGAANVITPSLTGVTLAADRRHGASAKNTVIDATGKDRGIVVQADAVTVKGLTFENAQQEGILVEPDPSTWPATATAHAANVSQVTIENNIVQNNDKAFDLNAANLQDGCPASMTDADDCGEGIHLLAASSSKVLHNQVEHNIGGILLSDGGLAPTSVGPAAHDLIAYNNSSNNAIACGITLPGHDPRAVDTSGQPQPALAGVYDNLIEHNVTDGNGGAGLLDATPFPGTAAYDNTFLFNHAANDGGGGYQLHSHAPQQDVNGNVVIGNYFGTDNTAGDPDSGDTDTTAIILFSAVTPVTGTVLGNVINGDTDGIWQTANVTVSGLGFNAFSNVGTNVFTQG